MRPASSRLRSSIVRSSVVESKSTSAALATGHAGVASLMECAACISALEEVSVNREERIVGAQPLGDRMSSLHDGDVPLIGPVTTCVQYR